MSEFKIEKGVPLPSKGEGLHRAVDSMSVGDSILVTSKSDSTIRQTAFNVQRGTTKKFTCRKSAEGGIRIWRIA